MHDDYKIFLVTLTGITMNAQVRVVVVVGIAVLITMAVIVVMVLKVAMVAMLMVVLFIGMSNSTVIAREGYLLGKT